MTNKFPALAGALALAVAGCAAGDVQPANNGDAAARDASARNDAAVADAPPVGADAPVVPGDAVPAPPVDAATPTDAPPPAPAPDAGPSCETLVDPRVRPAGVRRLAPTDLRSLFGFYGQTLPFPRSTDMLMPRATYFAARFTGQDIINDFTAPGETAHARVGGVPFPSPPNTCNSAMLVTVSRCPGDFRSPSVIAAGDPFMRCAVLLPEQMDILVVDSPGRPVLPASCEIRPDEVVYLNITLQGFAEGPWDLGYPGPPECEGTRAGLKVLMR